MQATLAARSTSTFPLIDGAAYWVEPGTGDMKHCKVEQLCRNGQLLISGSFGRRLAERAEVADPAKVRLKPFGRWLMERVTRSASRITAVEYLVEDYLRFCASEALAVDRGFTRLDLARLLESNGYRSRPTTYAPQFTTAPVQTVGFPVVLRRGE